MKFLLSLLGFIVIISLIVALYKAGSEGTALTFFLIVGGAVLYSMVRG